MPHTDRAISIRAELEADADPHAPICTRCHSPLVRPHPSSHGWVCPYDVDQNVVFDWELVGEVITLDDIRPHAGQVVQ